jgi:hypothetical protein
MSETLYDSPPFDVVFQSATAQFAYLAGMAYGDVRALSGTYAPTNGKATIQSATPSIWLTGDPGNNDGDIVSPWCGGAGDPANSKLYMAGGGHTNSANNGVYCFDFSGTNAPVGMTLLPGSQTDISGGTGVCTPDADQYSDGKCSARHTYDGLAFVDGKFYVFSGGEYGPSGGYKNSVYKFTLGSPGAWARCPDVPNLGAPAVVFPSSAFDPVSKKVFFWYPSGSSGAFYDTVSDTWGSVKTSSAGIPSWDYATTVCDASARSRLVRFGGQAQMWTVAWGTAGSHTGEAITSVGPHAITGNMANSQITALYDSVRDCFWTLGGSAGAQGYSTIYQVDPVTFASTAKALSQTMATTSTTAVQGSYKRATFIGPNNSAIGFVTGFSAPTYVIKLP